MKLRPSTFNHYLQVEGGNTLVFNKMHGSVAILSDADFSALENVGIDQCDERSQEFLSSGFAVSSDVDEFRIAQEKYDYNRATNARLSITIETTQSCNLACPFCYQNKNRETDYVLDENLDWLGEYVREAINSGDRSIELVDLGIIGGEPLLQKERVLEIVQAIRKRAESEGVGFESGLDTNGVYLTKEVVREFSRINLPLSERHGHDVSRVQKNGKGSYQQILDALHSCRDELNCGTQLNIKYIVNKRNAEGYQSVYADLDRIGLNNYQLSLYNTLNYNFNYGESARGLDARTYSNLFIDFLRFKFDNGIKISEFPFPAFMTCRAYLPLNIKIDAKGRLLRCNSDNDPFSNSAHFSPLDLVQSENLNKGFSPFENESCGKCSNVGICGGELLCKMNPEITNLSACDFLEYDLDDYLTFFAENYPNKPEAFSINGW